MTNNEFIRNPHLDGDDFYWLGNQTGILLIHGFNATTAEVRPLAEKLHAAGYTTAGPLLPGHGTHPDDLNRSKWEMWVEKIKSTYEQLTVDCTRVFICGASMGAVLALELARQHPEAAGVILFAPAIKVKGLWRARIIWPFHKYQSKNRKEDNLPWKGYTVYPVRGLVELHKLQKHVQRRLAGIPQPLVVFTGEYDQHIAPDAAKLILEGVSSKDKQHIHMRESDHCITLDRELDLVSEHVIGFIEKQ